MVTKSDSVSQKFIQASSLVSIAAQLIQPFNNLAGMSLILQAQALLQEADALSANDKVSETQSLKEELSQRKSCNSCKDSNRKEAPPVSSEVTADVDKFVKEIELLIAQETSNG